MRTLQLCRTSAWVIASLLLVYVSTAEADDCTAITKYGIFDIRKTSSQTDLIDDLIKWLSVNEYKSESDARNAALRAGFTIPLIDIAVNADGTYGEQHSSTWSKATQDYLKTHTELHTRFSQEFTIANPDIVRAWQDCVTRAVGLICWAKQTDRKNEVLLNLEVRPITLPLSPPRITTMVHSDNVAINAANWRSKVLNTKPTPLLFSRSGAQADEAGNFVVDTTDPLYRCSADVPSLPPPAPIYTSKVLAHTSSCVVGRLDMTNEGPKIGDKHLLGVHCSAPETITSVTYLGCYGDGVNLGGASCDHLNRHAEYDIYQGNNVNLRFATDSGDNLVVKFNVFYTTTERQCTANCEWKLPGEGK